MRLPSTTTAPSCTGSATCAGASKWFQEVTDTGRWETDGQELRLTWDAEGEDVSKIYKEPTSFYLELLGQGFAVEVGTAHQGEKTYEIDGVEFTSSTKELNLSYKDFESYIDILAQCTQLEELNLSFTYSTGDLSPLAALENLKILTMVMKGASFAEVEMAPYTMPGGEPDSDSYTIDQPASFNNTPGAIGVMNYATAKENGYTILSMDGVYPNDETLDSGAYPIVSTCYALYRVEDKEAAPGKFAQWLTLAEGKDVIRALGWVPTGGR